MNDNPFVYPQTSAKPIATNYLRDEGGSVEVVEKDASGAQRVIATGGAIPVVFGKFDNGTGGVWVSPPAARIGFQIKDTENSGFSYGLVVSDGQIRPIGDSDIYKGSFALADLTARNYTNAYGFMPEVGYDYSFSETVSTPGTPGTDGETNYTDYSVTINQSNSTYINTSNYVTVLTRSTDKAINVTLRVTEGSTSNAMPFGYRILANNIVVKSGTGNGSASTSYNAGKSVSWRIELKATQSDKTGLVKCVMTGTGTRTRTSFTPGTPAVPPVYTTTGLPLFAGAGGNFIGLSCLAIRAEYEPDSEQGGVKEQARCFVRGGIYVKNVVTGAVTSSSNFMDLAYYLLKANNVSDELIDRDAMKDMHNFLNVNGLRYNGVIAASTNLREFFSAVAPGMMLKFVQDSGKFSFKPLLPLDSDGYFDSGSITPAKIFTNLNIVEGSYRKSYFNTQLRKPFCALLTWREQQRQKYSSLVTSEFRYESTAIDGPFETYDYSDFITDVNHASTVANYILSSRARTTHAISFSTYVDSEVPDERLAGQLAIMDVIRVSTSNSTALNSDEFYQIRSVTESANGLIDIEAIHFPSDDKGASLVAADVLASVPPAVPNPIPDGGNPNPEPGPDPEPGPPPEGIGILSIAPIGYEYTAGMLITFTATYDGTATDVTFNWFGPPGTNAPISTTGPVLSWTAGGAEDAGGYTCIAVSPTAPDSGKRATAGLDYQPFYKMSGGSMTTDGDFRIHTFTASGTLTIDFAPPGTTFEYLICGPGGGVQNPTDSSGGGAGGGGVLTGNRSQSTGSYPITVGVTAGVGSPRTAENNSSAFGLTALHGGDGGYGRVFANVVFTGDGGCGGGSKKASNSSPTIRPGSGSQGGNGAAGDTVKVGFASIEWGGGGGGASGANGTSGSQNQAGNGGEGVASSISGSNYVYGSGGAGGLDAFDGGRRAQGGTGAGQGGGQFQSSQFAAIPPTNYGAGASCGNFVSTDGEEFMRGIQGIVIVRYQYK